MSTTADPQTWTVEQLDALPFGSILLDAGDTYCKTYNDLWNAPGLGIVGSADVLAHAAHPILAEEEEFTVRVSIPGHFTPDQAVRVRDAAKHAAAAIVECMTAPSTDALLRWEAPAYPAPDAPAPAWVTEVGEWEPGESDDGPSAPSVWVRALSRPIADGISLFTWERYDGHQVTGSEPAFDVALEGAFEGTPAELASEALELAADLTRLAETLEAIR